MASGTGMSMPILTLTMNPALDISTSADSIYSGHKLRCGSSRIDPGGGGANVARVIHRLGGQAVAMYTAGGTTGDTYRHLMEAEGIPVLVAPVRGSTRQNFTVDELSTGRQFRFVLEGAELSGREWRNCLRLAARAVPAHGYVVASGSLPPGAPVDFYARVAQMVRKAGARCIVDTSGLALAAALGEGVFMVKPSRRELSELVGADLNDERNLMEAASGLIAQGSAEYVALTLGEDGALLASASGAARIAVPPVKVVSAVGAGDSFLAAFVLRLAQGNPPETALRTAVAAGSAAVLTPATELCRREDVERLEADMGPAGGGPLMPYPATKEGSVD
ncbi:1-phosphofructokinase family hexose kinase [Arthrobacter silvisoli]|uniref:1-phosphofructokinase family hexose kinase n=1 Tax=Arthrobacter silvisoli TaxID=2291022 RepID=UPI001B35276C|nr:1-phosphofructokinase family hexose kinase [Arthrobacter silvisoli]